MNCTQIILKEKAFFIHENLSSNQWTSHENLDNKILVSEKNIRKKSKKEISFKKVDRLITGHAKITAEIQSAKIYKISGKK